MKCGGSLKIVKMVTSQSLRPSALLSLPPALLKKYNSLILTNPSTVTQIESTLRSLTYLLPGARLNDSELASESIYSFTNLLSLYHDSVLAKSPTHTTSIKSNNAHARYTKFWTARSKLYRYLARILNTIQYTELLWEMIGRRKGGERGRWRVVVFLESFKAIIRICLCWLTGGRWVLSSPLPDREDVKEPQQPQQTDDNYTEWLEQEKTQPVDKDRLTRWENGLATPPMSDSEKAASSSSSPHHEPSQPAQSTQSSQPNPPSSYTLPRTNITLPSLPSASQIASYLSSRTLSPSSLRPAQTLLHRLTSRQSQIAELLYILRPLIFALLMQRLATRHVSKTPNPPSAALGRPAWKSEWMPWIIGLGMEVTSRQLMKRDIEARVPGGLRGLSEVEKEEVKRRGWSMGWWVMRGAFYETYTRYIIPLFFLISPTLTHRLFPNHIYSSHDRQFTSACPFTFAYRKPKQEIHNPHLQHPPLLQDPADRSANHHHRRLRIPLGSVLL